MSWRSGWRPLCEGPKAVGTPDEIVAIVDARNNVIGAASRREMRARGLTHRSTYVLVFNAEGEIYVHKRTATKDVFAGHYDATAGGVVLAGEDYEQGARRELEEELGIRGAALSRLFDFFYNDGGTRVWGAAFACVCDGNVVPQEDEIESGAFMKVGDVLRLAETRPFAPDGLCVLRRYLGQVRREGCETRDP